MLRDPLDLQDNQALLVLLVHQELPDLVAHLAVQVLQVMRDHQDPMDNQDHQDLWDLQVSQVQMGILGLQVRLDPLDHWDLLDLLVIQDSRAPLANRDLQDPEVVMDCLETPGHPDHLDHQVHRAILDRVGLMVRRARLGCLGHRET